MANKEAIIRKLREIMNEETTEANDGDQWSDGYICGVFEAAEVFGISMNELSGEKPEDTCEYCGGTGRVGSDLQQEDSDILTYIHFGEIQCECMKEDDE